MLFWGLHLVLHLPSTTTPQPSSDSGFSSGTISGVVVGMVVVLALIIGACIYPLASKRRKANVAQDIQIQNLDQTDRKLSTHPNDAAFQESQPFVRPELPGSIPANSAGEKPELIGCQVRDD